METRPKKKAKPDPEKNEDNDKRDPGHVNGLEFLENFKRFRRVLGQLLSRSEGHLIERYFP